MHHSTGSELRQFGVLGMHGITNKPKWRRPTLAISSTLDHAIAIQFNRVSKRILYILAMYYGVLMRLQLAVYRGSSGIQALMNSNAMKLAERDEAAVIASGIPYTIIRAGSLQNSPGGEQGFSFKEVFFFIFSSFVIGMLLST